MRIFKQASIIALCVILSLIPFSLHSTNKILLLGVATCIDNTGLINYLKPHFTRDTGIDLKWLVAGSGKILQLGKKGDIEIAFVHLPELENEYLKDDSYIKRAEVMKSNFVLVGPDLDPAHINGMNIIDALLAIKKTGSTFVSRGDESGTHAFETSLWNYVGINPKTNEDWYMKTGEGMLATSNFCAKVGGYTIIDEGTYLKHIYLLNRVTPLRIFIEGEERLKTIYNVLLSNPKNHPNRDSESASSFFEWITGSKAKKLIKSFKLEEKHPYAPSKKIKS